MLSSLQGNSSFSSVAHSSGSRTYSKDLQCTGRLSVSLPQSSQHRVGTTASSVRRSCSAVGSSSCRYLCYQSESQTGNLCISSSRPSGLRSRCHVSLGTECSPTPFIHSAFFFKCFSRSCNQIARSYLLHQPGQNKHGFQNFCFCLVPSL